jgi:two-component system cell cycle sensor histidine kinase/response regulator CckA
VRLPSDRRLIRGSIIDRTERIRMDEQMAEWQKMDALGQLAAGIAHDFNNVLTVVGTAAQCIEASPSLPADVMEDVRAIREETARGAALASQLLAYSQRQTLPPEALSLNDVVHSIAFALRRVIPSRIEVVEQLDAGPAIVSMHRSQAEQVLMNLVLNARDAIGGKGAIHVSTQCGETGTVLLRVADSGTGMSEETRVRSLEPFFSTKPAGKGTGLGLSTVNTIVKNAGGQIVIESTPGEGTTVTITLPALSQPTEQ